MMKSILFYSSQIADRRSAALRRRKNPGMPPYIPQGRSQSAPSQPSHGRPSATPSGGTDGTREDSDARSGLGLDAIFEDQEQANLPQN